MAVPDGTVQEVLDWVGDDPDRAQEALDAERDGHNRSTLITKLEALACGSQEGNTMTTFDPSQPTEDPATPSENPNPPAEDPGEQPAGPDAPSQPSEAPSEPSQQPEGQAEQLFPGEEAPPQPEEVTVNPADEGVTVFATVPRSLDVDLPEPIFGVPQPVATGPTTTGTVRVGVFDREVSDEQIEGEPIDGTVVEYLDGAAGGRGLALGFNGDAFLLDRQMAAALKGIVDKAIAGMAL